MYNPNRKLDFYWPRMFICTLIGAGAGASAAYLLEMSFQIFILLGIAIGVSFSTMITADKVYGIKPDKKEKPISFEKMTEIQFEDNIPDEIKDFKKDK